MSVSNDVNNVSTTRGIRGGYAFCAPVGTPLPTDIETELDAAFENVGFISEDGWKENLDTSSENIPDMNGDTVDTYSGENTETLAMTLIEMSKSALSVQYGHKNVSVDSTGKLMTVKHNWGNAEEYLSWVLELVLKNGRRWRKVIESAKKTDLGEFTGNSTTVAGREVTLTYQQDKDGTGCVDYFEVTPDAKSLDDMTVDELKAYAAEKSISLTGKTTKAEILAAIKAAEAAAGDQGTE